MRFDRFRFAYRRSRSSSASHTKHAGDLSFGACHLTRRGERAGHNSFESLECKRLFAADAELLADISDVPAVVTVGYNASPSFLNVPLFTVNDRVFFARTTESSGTEVWVSDGTAQGTHLVKDVVPGGRAFDARRIGFAELNGAIYFTEDNGLWKTDGTEAGTVLVRSSISANGLVSLNGMLFFFVSVFRDGANWFDLWKSDGTSDGTYLIKTGFGVGESFYAPTIVQFRDDVYFTAYDDQHGWELWKTDGTTDGTELFKDIDPGVKSSSPFSFTVSNGLLFFAATDTDHGLELWKSDGTPNGTISVRDIVNGFNGSTPVFLTDVNGTLFFSANDDTGRELWKSDGTAVGTTRVKDIASGASWGDPQNLVSLGGKLYFRANTPEIGTELWTSDGTSAGTQPVSELAAGNAASSLDYLTRVGDKVFFQGSTGEAWGLWTSDGTRAGTVQTRTFTVKPTRLTQVGDRLFFVSNNELWTSDGTSFGTKAVIDARTLDLAASSFTEFRESLYFAVNDELHGGLWRSAGTSASTVRVHAFAAMGSIHVVGSSIFFAASDGVNGNELWMSDGTEQGTHLVTDLSPGISGSDPQGFVVDGSTMYFAASTPETGQVFWKITGPAPTLEQVTNATVDPTSAQIVNGRLLYFTALPFSETWATDGTLGGNVQISVDRPEQGVLAANSYYYVSRKFNFPQPDVVEVWKTDGTVEGAKRVLARGPAATNFFPVLLGGTPDMAFIFEANDRQLWVDDRNGLRNLGQLTSAPFYQISNTNNTTVGGRFYFKVISINEGAYGELWQSDGSSDGTKPILDEAGARFQNVLLLGALSDQLYFASAHDGLAEVWQTNGTASGTKRVPGTESKTFLSVATIGQTADRLYLNANDGISGDEPWIITANGAELLSDIAGGSLASQPQVVVPIGDRDIIFAADDRFGRELWVVNRSVPSADDRNRNGVIDINDLDLLCSAVRAGNASKDNVTAFWQNQRTGPGDVNFDHQFDSSDLISIFQIGKYETGEVALWHEGDWNCDGIVDTSDLVAAFQQGAYEQGPM